MQTVAAIPNRTIPIQAIAPLLSRPRLQEQSLACSNCSNCNMRRLCVPSNSDDKDVARLDEIVHTRRRLKRGESLYRAGEVFQSIYAIRSGFFKTQVISEDGREQVTGFQMAADVIGMDGIDTDTYKVHAVALEDSEVCVIPFSELEELAGKVRSLQRQIHKVMCREITHDQGVMMMLGRMRAEERIAAFLLNLSQRFVARGYASSDFNLRMKREEIGSYLGLTFETVSRIFSKFQAEKLIEVHQKHIRITSIANLRQMTHSPVDGATH